MALILKRIEADPEKLANGAWWRVWVTPTGSLDGEPIEERDIKDNGALLVVPAGGILYDRVLEEEQKPHFDKIREKKLTPEESRLIQGRVLGRAVLKGWRNISWDGTTEAPYSEELAIQLMTEEKWRTARDFVSVAQGVRAAVLARQEAEAKGN